MPDRSRSVLIWPFAIWPFLLFRLLHHLRVPSPALVVADPRLGRFQRGFSHRQLGLEVANAILVRPARAGVEVRIGDGALPTDPGAGTRVTPDAAAEVAG